MKYIGRFIVWQWTRWDSWQKIYSISVGLVVFGIFIPSILGTFMLLLGLGMFFVWMTKWALWDSVKEAYKEFLKDREMKAEKPASGIMKIGDWGDAKSYKVACNCGSSDHEHTVWIEAEETGINVNVYATVRSEFWKMNRWQQIWRLITKGYLEHETVISMNEQEALNYAETLKTAIGDVKALKEKRKNGTN